MKKMGFTLAEVLITLVIIGVIAAITIPLLLNQTQGEEYRSAFKKAVSNLNNALTLNYSLEGTGAHDFHSNEEIKEMFANRLHSLSANTWSAGDEANTATGQTISCESTFGGGDSAVLVLTDGVQICFKNFYSADSSEYGSACDVQNTTPCLSGEIPSVDDSELYNYANILVDINGNKRPNLLTTSSASPKDVYPLILYSQKIVPFGKAAQEIMFEKTANSS